MEEIYPKVKTAVVGCGSISSIHIRSIAAEMNSRCSVRPLAPGFYSTVWGSARADAERSLVD